MDEGERLARLETKVDALQVSIGELKEAIDFLERQIMQTYFCGDGRPGTGIAAAIKKLCAIF